MKNMTICIILTVFLLISAGSNADTQQNNTALQIYLPGEITLDSNAPNLGQVAIIRGDALLTARAEKIALGRISSPDQKITIDRPTLLSRLACSGISASEVTLAGADKIIISQQHQIIKGSEFVESALGYLKNNPSDASICQYIPIQIPQDLTLSDIDENIRLSPSLAASNIKNQAKILVSVLYGDKEIGSREVMFLLKYTCRRAVAQVDISAGTFISP